MQLNNNTSKLPAWVKKGGVVLFWLTVWYLLAAWVGKELLLPGPRAVGESFCRLIVSGKFWLSTFTTMGRVITGFICGMLGGVLLAALMQVSPLFSALFAPLIKAVRAAPVASFIILALVWISSDRLPIFISFLMVLPVAWANAMAGVKAADPQLLEMAHLYGLRRPTVLRRIYLPSLKPYLLSAANTGLGLAWKSGVTAEVIASPRFAIGSELNTAKVTLEMPDMLVWTLVVVLMSLLLEYFLHRALGVKK